MRDPKRIKRMLQLVELLWSRQPDLRFGQLVANLARFHDPHFANLDDLFSVEDDIVEEKLARELSLLERLAIESDN